MFAKVKTEFHFFVFDLKGQVKKFFLPVVFDRLGTFENNRRWFQDTSCDIIAPVHQTHPRATQSPENQTHSGAAQAHVDQTRLGTAQPPVD